VQPVDLDLRRDSDGQVTDSGSTDLPRGADEPPAWAVKRRHHGDHLGDGEQPGLVGCQRDFDGLAELSELDGHNRAHGCGESDAPPAEKAGGSGSVAVPAARRSAANPYRSPRSRWP